MMSAFECGRDVNPGARKPTVVDHYNNGSQWILPFHIHIPLQVALPLLSPSDGQFSILSNMDWCNDLLFSIECVPNELL